MMKKIIIGICATIVQQILFTGCTTTYEQSDIKQYVKDLGFKSFKVQQNYVAVEGEDGYTDKVWEVTTSQGFKFHVIDDKYWQQELLMNQLTDDVAYSAVKDYIDENPDNRFQLDDNGGINTNAVLQATYQNYNDLKEIINDFQKLKQEIKDLPIYGYDVMLQLIYTSDVCKEFEVYTANMGRTSIPLDGDFDDYIDEALETGRECALLLADFDADILEGYDTQSYDGNRKEIKINNTDGTVINTEILGYQTNPENGQVTFGGLYYILKKAGYNVNGSFDHYSFQKMNGDTIEVSYQFNDELVYSEFTDRNLGKSMVESYYYKVNGIVYTMDYYFYCWIDFSVIEQWTGIVLQY